MELLNVAMARSIWLFDINDLNPRGKSITSHLLDWLKDFYGFSKFPTSVNDQEPDTKSLAFLQGDFQLKEEFFIEVDLRIYNDGLVADTRSSTSDTDLFLKDVLESASKELSLNYREGLIRKRLYASELNVRCDHPLTNLNPRLKSFCEKLSNLARTALPSSSFEVSSIGFWMEPITPTPTGFRIERKHSTSFSDNRYWSTAPTETAAHLELLNELDSILSEA